MSQTDDREDAARLRAPNKDPFGDIALDKAALGAAEEELVMFFCSIPGFAKIKARPNWSKATTKIVRTYLGHKQQNENTTFQKK